MLETLEDIIIEIQEEYPYIAESKIKKMLQCAIDILLNALYPFDEEKVEIPKRKYTWLYRCIVEQIERKGMTSYVGYSENGLSVNFDRTQISQGLLDEITTQAGIF